MIFEMDKDFLERTHSIFTATEIHQQPSTWKKTFDQINQMKEEITLFLNRVLNRDDYDVILTGAGTSEFIGNALAPYLNQRLHFKVKSYATTDITATPEDYISNDKHTLLISFGRSGNSPESIGAIDNALAVSSNLHHLFITCNKNGALSKRAENDDRCLAINLTDETHDQAFAMTSSFSNMYLATLLIFNINHLEEIKKSFEQVVRTGDKIINHDYPYFKSIIDDYNFKRIVYLGSNTLKGIAQESALKMLELTAGRVVTMFDTPLGFRHGPKSVINDDTLIVIYLSDCAYTRQYEVDLIKEMSAQKKGNKIFVICNTNCDEVKDLCDYYFCFENHKLENAYIGLEYVICAQLIALYKSLSLDITPDNPCPTGEVNRVVKGVKLYPYGGKS